MTSPEQTNTPAIDAARALGLEHEVTRHGRVSSLAEAAAARGVLPRDLVKTLVVRLDILPLVAKVSRHDTAPEGVWLSLKQLDTAPLPAPIRRILEKLADG